MVSYKAAHNIAKARLTIYPGRTRPMLIACLGTDKVDNILNEMRCIQIFIR